MNPSVTDYLVRPHGGKNNSSPWEKGRFFSQRAHKSRFLFVLLLLACGGYAERTLSATNVTAQIEELVSCYHRLGYLNGSVLVAQQGHVLYAKGVGEANRQSHKPNTPQTRFDIASITKQFTAVLVLQQVAKGKLRLEGTVSEYLSWYRKDTGQRMTVDQLLHHTSGLPPDYNSPQFSDSAEACHSVAPQTFAERFCQPALVSEPGTKWAYSNCGYVLLGLILERVTGETFSELLRQQLIVPLGMKNTGMDCNDLVRQGGAVGYTRHAGPRYTIGPCLDRNHIFAAGGMYSTVEDLFLWNQALSSGELLPADLQEQIFKPGMGSWGYGWFVTKIGQGAPGAGQMLAEMRGDMPGNFFAWTLRFPEQQTLIIVLRNAYGSTEHFEENLQAILFGQQPRLPARSPKDIVAHAWLVSCASLAAHPTFSLTALLLGVLGVGFVVNRNRTPLPSPG